MNPREFEQQFKDRSIDTEIKPIGLDCIKCWDGGFVWIQAEIPVWAYCRCKNGKLKSKSEFWVLPDFDFQMEQIYRMRSFPYKAFIPSPFEGFKTGMERKTRDFKNDLKTSEKYWIEQSKNKT